MKIAFILLLSPVLSFAGLSVDLPSHYSGTCTPDNETCVYFSPQDMPVEAVRAYLNSAKKTIRIATYNMSIKDYADVLLRKANEGVKIEYMVDFKLSFNNKLWPRLLHENITKYRLPVMRGGNPQMHNKLIIIDDKVALNGSANYSSFGLISNYENVVATQKKSVITKFNDEINELKALSLSICNNFRIKGHCDYQHEVEIEPLMKNYLTSGKFPQSAIEQDLNDCAQLTSTNYKEKKALFNQTNNPTIFRPDLCFKDKKFGEKIKKLIDDVAQIEKYVDGTLTTTQRAFWRQPDNQKGDYKLYFSPEDDVEKRILDTLETTLENPHESFAYISTNFITNWKIASMLKKLKENGVRIRAFFDRGRFVDRMFAGQLKTLSSLGFHGDPGTINSVLSNLDAQNFAQPGDLANQITIFDNQLTGAFACNHNKWAIIGTDKKLTLLNGSANWSNGAMKINDEHLMIIEDEAVATIFLREMVSQMFVYRYGQDANSPQLWDDIEYLDNKASCLKTLLGLEKYCHVKGKKWAPQARSTAIISMSGIPAGEDEKVYIWVDQLNDNMGGMVPMYTNDNFAGKWLSTIPAAINWDLSFHIYIEGKQRDPVSRQLKLAPFATQVIKQHYQWGM